MPINRLCHSDYLSSIKRRYPDLSDASTFADLQKFEQQLDVIEPCDKSAQQLRESKARFDYIWAQLRLEQAFDDIYATRDSALTNQFGQCAADLGKARTNYAAKTIDKALQIAWSDPALRRFLSKEAQQQGHPVPGLFILGMGKLGGYDLNFSSDIDLIAFYDPDLLPVAQIHGRTDVCARALKATTQILSKSQQGQFVWRVDWRLRPDASVTPIVMSTKAAEDFYFFHSLPWHRLAMLKARPVAGDLKTGWAFLNDLTPYIWRQYLDYSAVDEVARLKERINLEHPQLKLARTSTDADENTNAQFNLKLGEGGIREIEFIANAMQLLWGGKKPALRHFQTLEVFHHLAAENLLSTEVCAELRQSYTLFRLVEDALQILDNQQTHTLPQSPGKLDVLCKLLGCENADSLHKSIDLHRARVRAPYGKLFSQHHIDGPSDSSDIAIPDNPWADTLPPKAQRIWQDWTENFSLYAVPRSSLGKLKPLLQALYHLVNQATDKSAVICELHDFFYAIPKGGQYLRLLAANPVMTDAVLTPLVQCPPMSVLLHQSPHIVDYLMEGSQLPRPAEQPVPEVSHLRFDSDFVLRSEDFEVRLQRLRRFVNEQLYDQMLGLTRGRLGSQTLQQHLSDLAEYCLSLGLNILNEDMGYTESPIAILGMGKLGMRAMAPLSDLDLIFIADAEVELDAANRYANRFRHLMEVKTSEGRAYEMDMRLRPSGRAGPVTVSLDGFKRYHQQSARTWEQIALVPSRSVAGPDQLRRQIERQRTQILGRERNYRQCLTDAKKMHNRIREQRIDQSRPDHLNIKLRPGGLFELDYLCACLCLLQPLPEETLNRGYTGMMDHVLNPKSLGPSVQFWRSLQIWSRMLGIENKTLADIPHAYLDLVLQDLHQDTPQQLDESIQIHSQQVARALDDLFAELGDIGDLNDWEEQAIQWH